MPNSHRLHIAGRPLVAFTAVLLIGLLASSCGDTQHTLAMAPGDGGLAVLDEAWTSSDRLPAEIVTALTQSVRPEFNRADIHSARRVLPLNPGWLMPAVNGQICLVRLVYPLISTQHGIELGPTPSYTCASEAATQEGHLVETQSLATSGTDTRNARVVGVVPNGVSAVTLVSSEGRRTVVPVFRNAFEAIIWKPTFVRFVVRDGNHKVGRSIRLSNFSSTSVAPPQDPRKSPRSAAQQPRS
jgi:hypothetical protein